MTSILSMVKTKCFSTTYTSEVEFSKSSINTKPLSWKVEQLGYWINGNNPYVNLVSPKLRDWAGG